MPVITSQEERAKLSCIIENREHRDIVFFHHHACNVYCVSDKDEWGVQMKAFRKKRKEGTLLIREENNKTFVIGDEKKNKTLHFLVVQHTDEEKNPTIDPIGLAVKDKAFMVSGMIYAFKSITNRDASYKYIMGIK